MILDARALREGERLSACSDLARLWWPYLAAAGNGYGRMAITYRVVQAYGMADPPSEEEFFNLIQEYRRNWLLFLYIDSATGDLWGQWYLVRLPTQKTRADEASPAPPADEYRAWLAEYAERKRRHAQRRFGQLPETGRTVIDPAAAKVLGALQETFPSADDTMARRIVQAARAAAPQVTADQIIEAMKQVYKRQQESPGLFLTTVPAALPAILRRDQQWREHQQRILAEPSSPDLPMTEEMRRRLEESDQRRLMGLSG